MSKVDFSILNDTDIFYVDCISAWLNKGDIYKTDNNKSLDIKELDTYENNKLTTKENVRALRLATEEEIELFYKYFPEEPRPKKSKTKVIIDHLTIKDMQEAGWKFSYTK